MISVVAKSYGIHPQTLRLYEREGLLKPSRTEGNTRLYSEDDLRQLEVILNLTRDLGVNLAGVEIVLNMRRKMEQMQARDQRVRRLGARRSWCGRTRRAGRSGSSRRWSSCRRPPGVASGDGGPPAEAGDGRSAERAPEMERPRRASVL